MELIIEVRGVVGYEHRSNILERNVCIIGDGSAGTYAAIRLTDGGHSVAVIEKQDRLGGHTVTYTDPDNGTPLNMSVLIFRDLPIVRDYFGRLGVGLPKRGLRGRRKRILRLLHRQRCPWI